MQPSESWGPTHKNIEKMQRKSSKSRRNHQPQAQCNKKLLTKSITIDVNDNPVKQNGNVVSNGDCAKQPLTKAANGETSKPNKMANNC